MKNTIQKGYVCVIENPITKEIKHIDPKDIKVNGVPLEDILNDTKNLKVRVKKLEKATKTLFEAITLHNESISILNEGVNK